MNKKINYIQTNIIKGIAILLVLLGHLNIINKGGCYGVTLFLFISGYGIMCSYINNSLVNFWLKRIKNVLIPYFILTLVWIFIDYNIGIKYDFTTIVLSLLGINNAVDITMWYIKFLFFWYLNFYLIFKCCKKNNMKLVFLIVSNIVCFCLCKMNFFGEFSEGAIYVPFFSLGIIYKILEEKKIIIKYNFLPLIIILFLIFYNNVDTFSMIFLNFCCACIIINLVLMTNGNSNKLLKFIGNISYEIYLFEGVFFTKYLFLQKFCKDQILYIILYFILVLLLAFFYNKFIKYFYKFISNLGRKKI